VVLFFYELSQSYINYHKVYELTQFNCVFLCCFSFVSPFNIRAFIQIGLFQVFFFTILLVILFIIFIFYLFILFKLSIVLNSSLKFFYFFTSFTWKKNSYRLTEKHRPQIFCSYFSTKNNACMQHGEDTHGQGCWRI
jgi:hypothetical protein